MKPRTRLFNNPDSEFEISDAGETEIPTEGLTFSERMNAAFDNGEIDEPKEDEDEPPNDLSDTNEEEEEDDKDENLDDDPLDGFQKKNNPEQKKEEDTYDSDTEKLVKLLEEKGHPGDVYKKLRADLKSANLQIADLRSSTSVPKEVEQELEQLRSVKDEVEALRQRNQDLLQKNDQIAVRESDEYIKSVTTPLNEMDEVLAALSDQHKIPLDELEAIILEKNLVKQDALIEALSPKLGRRGSDRITRLSEDFQKIQQLRTKLETDAQATIARNRQQAAESEKKQKQEFLGTFKSGVTEQFSERAIHIPGFTDSSGSLTEIGKAAAAKASSIDPTTLDPSDLSFAIFAVQALPQMRREYIKMKNEMENMKTNKSSATPIGGKPRTTKKESEEEEPQGFRDKARGQTFTFTPPGMAFPQ